LGKTPRYAQVYILPLSSSQLSPNVWTSQGPRFFRFPVRSPRLGPGDGSRFLTSGAISACANRLFSSQFLKRLSNSSYARIYSVERLGEFRSTQTPVRVTFALTRSVFAGPDRTPKFNATWSGSALVDNLSAHFCAQSPAWLPSGILLNRLSRTFSSQFLLGRWPVSFLQSRPCVVLLARTLP